MLETGHEIDGFYLRGHFVVHQGHVELGFEAGDGADATDEDGGAERAGKVDDEAIEGGDADVGVRADRLLNEGAALWEGEELLIALIDADG